jgi:small conductance mechanosensitive channel
MPGGIGQWGIGSWGYGVATLTAQGSGVLADRFTSLSFTLGDALLALAIILLSWLASRMARRGVLRASTQLTGVSDDLRYLGARITGYVVLFLGVGIALGVLGVAVQPLLAVTLLIAVVLVLALRGIADNFAAGIVIQTRRPLHLGDHIAGLGFEGTVRELNSRSVVIETADGRVVHLPNHKLLEDPIVNHTAVGRRRSEIEVRLAAPAHHARDITSQVIEAAASVPTVLADPAPAAFLTAAEPARTMLIVQVWHEPPSASAVTSAVVQAIADRLHQSGHRGVVLASRAAKPLPPPSL